MANYFLSDDGQLISTGRILNAQRKKAWEDFEKEQEEAEAWFKGGAFDDDKGNVFTDTLATIGGTIGDIGINILKGAGSLIEGVVDLGTYGVGEVADFLGADDFAEDAKAFGQKRLVEDFAPLKNAEDFVDNYSAFGGKADGLVQTVGQVGGIILTGGAGQAAGLGTMGTTALTSGAMFASSAGSSISEAYEHGATDGDAWTYGTIKGAGDAVSEMIFGGLGKGAKALGIGKGLSSADDMLAKTLGSKVDDVLTKKFGERVVNSIAKNMTEMGVKATAEGAEEVLAGLVSAAGKKASYMSESDYWDLVEDEELLDQFIAGALTSGIMQSGGTVKSTKSGRDYVTGLTSNEQKVVDKEIENRITEAESDGTKLSNKEKSAIEEQVRKDLEKGYISIDTIESALGGETYNSYKTAIDNETKLEEEIKELENMPNAQITVKQSERLQEARKELEDIKQKDDRGSLKSKLDEEMSSLTANDIYLRESYNEKNRRGQKYEADVSKYDKGQQATIQKAIDSGILNNTNKTHEFVDMVAKISADKGVSFDFADNQKIKESGFAIEGKTVNGYVQGDNITLNVNSAKALNKVVGHEITHVLEGTELYEELQAAVKTYAETKGEYQARYDELAKLYEDVKDSNIENELTADLVGDYLFSDEDFISNLSTEKPNIFKRIYEEIKYLVKMVVPGSKEAKQLEKVKRAFDKAYKDNVATRNREDVNYSLIGTDENGIEVYETSDDTKKLTYTERKAQLLGLMKNEYAGRTAKFEKEGQVYYAQYDEAGVRKGIYGDKKSDKKGFNAKINIGADGDYIELAENALYSGSADEKGKDNAFHKDAISWDYFVKTIKADGTYYDVLINVKDTGNEHYVYDVTLTEKEQTTTRTNLLNRSESVPEPIITSSEQNASEKTQFSLSSDTGTTPQSSRDIYSSDVLYDPTVKDIAISQENSELPDDLPIRDDFAPNPDKFGKSIKTVQDRVDAQIENYKVELASKQKRKENSYRHYNRDIADKMDYLKMEKNQNSEDAHILMSQIEELKTLRDNTQAQLEKEINVLKERIKKMSTPEYKMTQQRKQKQQELREEMSELIGDTASWKDKKSGYGYKLHTLKRNLRSVIGNKEKADSIYRALQGTYNHNEAELNKESRNIKKIYADMHINNYEDQYIQMLGEYRHNPETTLTVDKVSKFYEKHKKKIDTEKVDKAIDMARDTYDNLFSRVNEVLKEYGIKEIPYREGYFPHFMNEPQGLISKLLNWKKEDNSIPTDIAGLTEHFKPNKSYQSFAQKRTSDVTDYSFLKGLDAYVFGALDWIHHIGDIQRFRAFENEIRYRHSEERVKEDIKKIEANEEFDAEKTQALIDGIYAEKNNPLNQLVQNIRTHTNILAGKKNTMDRAIEEDFNRNIYSIVKNASSRINANMVGGSISSALTNFIPITQSWSQVSPISSLRAMKDTIKSTLIDDGTIDKSDFLTNRLRTNENLSKSAWDKATDKISGMMEAIDSFTSQTIWRSKYLENVSSGMSEKEAIQNADEFAEGVMAGRSRGNMPVVFESKNPLAKIFTAFQLEVANQYDYMLKDMPQDMKEKTTGSLTKAYGTMFLGAYAYNALYSSLTGRDAAFDPIGIIQDLLKDLFDDEEDELGDIALDIIDAIGDEIPYIGGVFFNGGRIPISSALPYGEGVVEAITGTIEDATNGNWESVRNEWLNPVYYLALPAGGGQLKKMNEGLAMFNDDLPIAGSYTDSGNLRFAVEDTLSNKVQATLFGQWANENAQDYIENGRQPLKSKQIEEFAELNKLGMTQKEYWDYREGLKDQNTIEEKFDYIADLDFSAEQKNIMINNTTNRDEVVDLSNYDDFSSYEEFDYYCKNPEKYMVSKAIGSFDDYSQYIKALNEIKSDKDADGKTISGSRKNKVIEYINNLDADYGVKLILYKMEYTSDDTYNKEIIEYLNNNKKISYTDMETILKELGFTVEADGTVRWK